jgi:hypothetical protein
LPAVVLLITEGLQVPEIPLGLVVANTGAVVPLQIDGIAAKLGVVIVVQEERHVSVSEATQGAPTTEVMVKVT